MDDASGVDAASGVDDASDVDAVSGAERLIYQAAESKYPFGSFRVRIKAPFRRRSHKCGCFFFLQKP